MQRSQGTVKSVGVSGEGRETVTIRCHPRARPGPGQASLLFHPGHGDPCRHRVHPIQVLDDGFRAILPVGARWRPGEALDLLGPIGRAFSPPEKARRWLLLALDTPISPLSPLIHLGLASGVDVALAGGAAHPDLPADVEVLPSAGEALSWAEYLAACTPRYALPRLLREVAPPRSAPLGWPAEALLLADMPCGFGSCGACGVPTKEGWSLACQAGPVFDVERLRA